MTATRASHVAECRKRIRVAKRVELGMTGADSGPYYLRVNKNDASRVIGEAGFDLAVMMHVDGVAVIQPGDGDPELAEHDCWCCGDDCEEAALILGMQHS